MIRPSSPRPVPRAGVVALLVLVAALGGCGGSVGSADGGPTTSVSVTSTSSTSAAPIECPTPDGVLADFASTVVTVVAPDGERLDRCVAVVDRAAFRHRGLMHVEDLGPFAGMVFAYAEPSTGGYWMMNTPMPLSIAWIGDDGAVVSTADMEPCLDRGTSCPSYEPGAAYRWAVEVPQGGLAEFGLVDGAVLDVRSLPVGVD